MCIPMFCIIVGHGHTPKPLSPRDPRCSRPSRPQATVLDYHAGAAGCSPSPEGAKPGMAAAVLAVPPWKSPFGGWGSKNIEACGTTCVCMRIGGQSTIGKIALWVVGIKTFSGTGCRSQHSRDTGQVVG